MKDLLKQKKKIKLKGAKTMNQIQSVKRGNGNSIDDKSEDKKDL